MDAPSRHSFATSARPANRYTRPPGPRIATLVRQVATALPLFHPFFEPLGGPPEQQVHEEDEPENQQQDGEDDDGVRVERDQGERECGGDVHTD